VRFRRHDLHTLTGVYALDAVDGAERDLFEHHLRRCRPCGNEVRGLAETATELAMAAAMPPPPRVKEHVLAAAAVTRQLPPAVDRPGRTLRWTPRQVFRQSWTPRLAAAVAVVSLAVAVALGAVGLHTRHELDSARAQDQALAAVLAVAIAVSGVGYLALSDAAASAAWVSLPLLIVFITASGLATARLRR